MLLSVFPVFLLSVWFELDSRVRYLGSLVEKAGVSVVPVSPDWRNWRERMAGSEATDALAQYSQSHISSWSEGPALASVTSRVKGMVIPELVNSSPRC